MRYALLLLALPLLAADYDVLIRNGRVVDGSGAAGFLADVAVKDGRIAAVGKLAGATAAHTIDARGRIVAPGFIDVHTHVDGNLDRNPRAENCLLDGAE